MAILGLGLTCRPAAAYDFTIPGTEATGSAHAQVAAGAMLRTEARDPGLVGKTNLPGQEQFCEDKPLLPPGSAPGINCSNDVAGNAAYLKLPGLATVNTDNGDLDYDQGDLVSAALKVTPRLQLTWGDFGFDLSAVYFYDFVNADFREYHPNNIQDNNGYQPRHTQRPKDAERDVGNDFQLLDAYLSGALPLPGERQLNFKLGNQVLSIGTSTFLVLNSLNTVNPPDANLRNLPGSDIREVFRRVPLALLSSQLSDVVSAQAFYQFKFVPVGIPPIGSYFSTNDVLGAGHPYAALLFGKNREDPDNLMGVEERTQGNANLLSNAGRTIYVDKTADPSDQGEFGFSVGYLADWLNNTSFELAFLNLHSRFPLLSFVAADEGCVHNATNQAEAIIACQGFTTTPLGKELLPIDTVRIHPEYPENIQTLGLSFSTNLGPVAWTGEADYRPNQPLQIDPTDLGFAALQPVFPANTINYGVVAIPSRRVATPDHVMTEYRHQTVKPDQIIRGYERLQTLNLDTSLLLLQGASDNWFGADQVTTLLEVGGFAVLDMPDVDELQFAAPGVLFHHSAGEDGTGTPTPEQTQTGDENRLNPHYQKSGFADPFSWGYRIVQQYTYEDVLPSTRLQPQLAFFHDVQGRSPLPTGEFIEDRKQAVVGLGFTVHDAFSGVLRYTWFFDGGISNALSDRDNFQFNLAYDF